jgi:phage terminase small subunit
MTQAKKRRIPRKRRRAVEQDLLDQLERNGTYGAYYVDLVTDYMSLWDIKTALVADIEERGVAVKYQNSATQWGIKKNDSIAELNKTNAQMLKILQNLGIKPTAPGDDPDEEM